MCKKKPSSVDQTPRGLQVIAHENVLPALIKQFQVSNMNRGTKTRVNQDLMFTRQDMNPPRLPEPRWRHQADVNFRSMFLNHWNGYVIIWRNFRHRLNRKSSIWQLPVMSATKISSKWYFRFRKEYILISPKFRHLQYHSLEHRLILWHVA